MIFFNGFRQLTVVLLIVSGLLAGACQKNKASSSLLNYTRTAERSYRDAMDEFVDENCVDAELLFQGINNEFPYSRYATLAELRIADCKFIQGNFSEAAELYRQFVKVHPTHKEAHFAAYRRGMSYYKMIPGDYAIMPPPHERDQSATRDALQALTKFLNTYPESKWRERAEKYKSSAEDALVQHEIYVAEFYLRHDDRRAAAERLEGIQNSYPNSNLVPNALFLQAITFLEIDRVAEARRVFTEIVKLFPEHYQRRRAEDFLKHLDQTGRGENRGGDG